MAKLHGFDALIGDKVYDPSKGWGKVTSSDNTIMVDFAGMQFAYDANGYSRRTGNEALFWHPPVIVNPQKDLAVWENSKTALRAVHKAMGF